ncbi:D-alanyl-D-alanine carboxypeptidase/D-alanyl-D-alanine endopeptidase [Fusobacterium mortiferum]|uniref:D-alanyl-D-alanine carboxypeptidase/D-alanyl-D-alanine endopeptidase n=1 Tax=Fusobacterium mortiferum TaxID=850 RepID=UPI003F8EA7E1
MKKLRILVLALVILSSCTNNEIKDTTIKTENKIKEEVRTEEVITPSEILKSLEQEIGVKEDIDENREEIDETASEKIENTVEEDVIKEKIEEKQPAQKEEKKNISSEKIASLKSKGEKAIKNFSNLEMLEHSNIGIEVREIESGEIIAQYNKGVVITPASIMKVITSATALEVLGADTRLETKVVYDGKIDGEGTLTGDIYIIGGGDPTLGSDGIKKEQTAFMTEWISKVKSSGIKKIKGDIIVIDNLFGYVGVEEKWLWEDFGTNYGQGTYGISVFDNLYTLYLSSTDKKVNILGTKPEIDGLKFENRLKISPRGRRDFSVRGLPFENKRVLNGEVPANLKKIVTKSDIPNPALFLGQYFKKSLKNSGVSVNGDVKTSRNSNKRPKNPKTLAITKSATIEEMVRVLLKRSDNHYTEHLYQLLKLKDVKISEFWKEKGIDTKALVMLDGSGLSRGDYVSASILTDILAYMNENYPEFEKLLPRGGYEGTVSDFLEPKVFDGIVRVKSGSMSGIQSYTGYVEKDGTKLAFTIIVNHWNGSRNRLKDEMEKFINNLF